MAGPYPEFQVRLYRDGLQTPWGFRLQGGTDFKAPLTVQRVFVGSPAEGDLHRGDVICAIDNALSTSLTHKQAQDLIRQAGGSLSLRVQRGCRFTLLKSKTPPPAPQALSLYLKSHRYHRPLSVPAVTPTSPGMTTQFGVDFRHEVGMRPYQPPQQYQSSDPMLHKVQHSLDQANFYRGPAATAEDEPYQTQSIHDLKAKFTTLPTRGHHGGHRGRRWQKPDEQSGGGLSDFGWAPKNQPPAYSQDRYGPIRQDGQSQAPAFMQPPHQRQPRQRPVPAAHHVQQQHPSYAPHIASPQAEYHAPPTQTLNQSDAGTTRRPAWMGTLRSGHVLKPWEQDPGVAEQQANFEAQHHQPFMPQSLPSGPTENIPIHQPRVQTVHYAPGQAPQYKPDAAEKHSDTARVVHLQYNSPIGLYSTGNVKDTLHGQVHGKPGEGTMKVQGPPKEFDPSKSAVLKFMNQEAQQPKRRPVYHDPTAQRSHQPQQREPRGASDF